jgi:cardiolipin synthase (CMP-forming)
VNDKGGSMNKLLWAEFRTLPNLLTLSRVLLIPVFSKLLIDGKPRAAFLVFLVAGITDVLDGLAARLTSQKTKLGLWMDPAADKLLLTAAYILLSFPRIGVPNVLPIHVTALVIGRDVLIALTALFLYKTRGQKAFYPTLLGKASTVIQVLAICSVIVCNAFGEKFAFLPWIYDATIVATLASGIQYAWLSRPMFRVRRKQD